MKRMVLLVCAACLICACAAAQETPRGNFTVGTISAVPGTRASGFLEVPKGVDAATRIPVTILHGAKPGPVFAIIAGTHGYEYSPVVAMQRFPAKVDPRELSGTVIVVHVANMPSFLGRTIYYSPVDGKNLNRVYPGKAGGTVSERIAFAITHEVIDRADYVIDLHCGDGNEALRPYAYWEAVGTPEMNEKTRQMVVAFGLDHIVIETERPKDREHSVYTSNTAIVRGKPAITTETGLLGRVDTNGADLAEAGVFNLLRHFHMLAGEPRHLPGMSERTMWIDRSEVLRSSVTGIFRAQVQPDQNVAQGELLGVLTDFFGNTVQEVRAPFAGIVLYVVGTPPVSPGEPLGMIGHIKPD